MKTLFTLLLILCIPTSVRAQETDARIPVPRVQQSMFALSDAPMVVIIEQGQPTLSPGQVFAFDYFKDDIATWAITRYERRMDGAGSWVVIPVTGGVENPPVGNPPRIPITYMSPPPALTSGGHTVEFRACNASACSAAGTMAFNAMLEPVPVFNIRIIPKPPGN